MKARKINVVGFDPSTSNWGIAFATIDVDTLAIEVTDLKLVETEPETKKGVSKQSDDLRRAKVVYEGMLDAVKDRAVVFSEIPFMNPGSYAAANFNSGLVTGVLSACPTPIIQVSPKEVKEASVGIRTATKEEMIEWAMETHPEAPWLTRMLRGKRVPTKANEHLADAVASIYAGIKSDQFGQLVTLMRHAKFRKPSTKS